MQQEILILITENSGKRDFLGPLTEYDRRRVPYKPIQRMFACTCVITHSDYLTYSRAKGFQLNRLSALM